MNEDQEGVIVATPHEKPKRLSMFSPGIDSYLQEKAEVETEMAMPVEPKAEDKAVQETAPPAPKNEAPTRASTDESVAQAGVAANQMLSAYSAALPPLKELVETQVRELGHSVQALKEFSNALPVVIDTILACRGRPGAHSKSQLSGRAAEDLLQLPGGLPLTSPSLLGERRATSESRVPERRLEDLAPQAVLSRSMPQCYCGPG